MKIDYIKNNGEQSYFIVRAKRMGSAFKPVLITPEGRIIVLYRNIKKTFPTEYSATQHAIDLINLEHDNVIIF